VAPGAERNEPTVFVHIEAGHEVELMGGWPDGRWLSFFCTAPWDRAIPWDAEYQLTVEGQRSSSTFLLDGSPGQRVVIKVVPASNAPRVAGVVLVPTGALAIPGGLLLALIGVQVLGDCRVTGCNTGGTVEAVAGLLIALAGVGALIGGAILLSQARGRVGARQTVADLWLPRLPERPDTAWLPVPVWRDSVRDSATGGAARVGIPIISRSFWRG
jgi:hypothetical protein